jgi:hypothetical protein
MEATHRRARHLFMALAVMAISACSTVRSPAEQGRDEREVRARVDKLLARYGRNDQSGVIEMLDTRQFTIFGSDLAEVVDTPEELRALMTADFALWKTAKFENIRDMDFRSDGTLATAYFVISFSPAIAGPIAVRFNTTWRRSAGEWFLTQSANSVPTTNQSAAEILKKTR